MKPTSHIQFRRKDGFTLVEIMIVVVIIGLLSALAMPAFQKARINSKASRIANDFRTFAGAFEVCVMEEGRWPPDGIGNEVPPLAQPYLKDSDWTNPPVDGAYWDWEGVGRHGVTASIALADADQNLESGVMQRVDDLMDDGNLATGLIRQSTATEYIYILQE